MSCDLRNVLLEDELSGESELLDHELQAGTYSASVVLSLSQERSLVKKEKEGIICHSLCVSVSMCVNCDVICVTVCLWHSSELSQLKRIEKKEGREMPPCNFCKGAPSLRCVVRKDGEACRSCSLLNRGHLCSYNASSISTSSFNTPPLLLRNEEVLLFVLSLSIFFFFLFANFVLCFSF